MTQLPLIGQSLLISWTTICWVRRCKKSWKTICLDSLSDGPLLNHQTLESQHPQLHPEVPSHPSHSEMGPPIVLMAVVPASESPKRTREKTEKKLVSENKCILLINAYQWMLVHVPACHVLLSGVLIRIFICTCHKCLGVLMIFPQVHHQI